MQGSSAEVGAAQLTVYVAQVSNSVTGTRVEASSTSAADSGNTMRYDPTSGQYLFNLGTAAQASGGTPRSHPARHRQGLDSPDTS